MNSKIYLTKSNIACSYFTNIVIPIEISSNTACQYQSEVVASFTPYYHALMYYSLGTLYTFKGGASSLLYFKPEDFSGKLVEGKAVLYISFRSFMSTGFYS